MFRLRAVEEIDVSISGKVNLNTRTTWRDGETPGGGNTLRQLTVLGSKSDTHTQKPYQNLVASTQFKETLVKMDQVPVGFSKIFEATTYPFTVCRVVLLSYNVYDAAAVRRC